MGSCTDHRRLRTDKTKQTIRTFFNNLILKFFTGDLKLKQCIVYGFIYILSSERTDFLANIDKTFGDFHLTANVGASIYHTSMARRKVTPARA